MTDAPQQPDSLASESPHHDQLVNEKIVVAYFLAALTFILISMLGGILMAGQLLSHNPLSGI